GQLGNGTTRNSLTRVSVSGTAFRVGLTTGAGFACSEVADATVQCWGSNQYGQLGTGTAGGSAPTPAKATALTDALAIVAGASHACVMHGDRTVSCWGNNAAGQLGNRTRQRTATPINVVGLTNTIAIVAGGNSFCSQLSTKALQCWGDNTSGQ